MLPRQDVTNTKNNLYEVNYTKMHLEEMLLYNSVQFNMSLIHFVLLISQSLKLKKYFFFKQFNSKCFFRRNSRIRRKNRQSLQSNS